MLGVAALNRDTGNSKKMKELSYLIQVWLNSAVKPVNSCELLQAENR